MPPTKFTIPLKPCEPTACNARVKNSEGVEGYCHNPPYNNNRCLSHNPDALRSFRREENDCERLQDESLLDEKAKEYLEDRRSLTQLDFCIAKSRATIEALEKRFPVSAITPAEAYSVERLRVQHADLVERRVDIELKLKLSLQHSETLWEQVQDLFEQHIVDQNTRAELEIEFGKLLNSLTQDTGKTAKKVN